MDIQIAQLAGVVVVVPKGNLDSLTATQVTSALRGLIERGQTKLAMDLGAVIHLDSTGLGVLVAAVKQARAAGGDLRLYALRDDVRLILEMTGLIRRITVYPSLEEALAAWG